jgi:hypothetical protein
MEPFDDPVLGRFVWDARGNEWQGELITPDGVRIAIAIDCDREAISLADREAFVWLSSNERALRDQLAEQMLELAEDWRGGRDEEEPEITKESFAARVELIRASAHAGGFFLDYRDGGMFGGHVIDVYVRPDGTMDDPGLTG